jgi:predicted DNA-binding transcriptional regulator AlpA
LKNVGPSADFQLEKIIRKEHLMGKFYSYKEIALELEIPVSTLYKYNADGVGPKTLKIGRNLRVHEKDYLQWLNELLEGASK